MVRLTLPMALAMLPVPGLLNHETAAGAAQADATGAIPFPPTMHRSPSARGRGTCLVPPPHSGDIAAPERRGGAAARRRWAGALRLGARHGRNG